MCKVYARNTDGSLTEKNEIAPPPTFTAPTCDTDTPKVKPPGTTKKTGRQVAPVQAKGTSRHVMPLLTRSGKGGTRLKFRCG